VAKIIVMHLGQGWAKRLQATVASGDVLDLAPQIDDDQLRGVDPAEWESAGRIPGEAIRELLLQPGVTPDPRGLRIRGAFIESNLNLDYATLPSRLEFENCYFENAPSFVQTTLPELVLSEVVLPGMSLNSARLSGNCMLRGLTASQTVSADNAHVGGDLILSGAKLVCPSDTLKDSLVLDGAEIAGGARLDGGLVAFGGVRAVGVRIGGVLSLGGSLCSVGNALNLNNANVSGGIFVIGELVTVGCVRAAGARIGGYVSLKGAQLRNEGGDALVLENTEVTGSVFMHGELVTYGRLQFRGARIGSQLVLSGATLNNEGGDALVLDGAEITGDVSLDEKLKAIGCVRAAGARIGGYVSLGGAQLCNEGGDALVLENTEVAGSVFMHGELVSHGRLQFQGARIGRQLVLSGATLNNEGGDALILNGAEITGDVFLKKLKAIGCVRAVDARIGGLYLNGATLTNEGGDALNLDRAEITGIVEAWNGTEADTLQTYGCVRAADARIGGLSLKGAKLNNEGGIALGLDRAEITSSVFLDEKLKAIGCVRAADARIGSLFLNGATLTNEGGDALNLDRAEITGNVEVRSGSKGATDTMQTYGCVRAIGAHVSGFLSLEGVTLNNRYGSALNLTGADVGALYLDEFTTSHGGLRFSFASIRVLSVGETVPKDGLPPLSDVQGWTLSNVHGFIRRDRKSAARWLDTVDSRSGDSERKEFASQPWKEMAKIYDQIGQPEDGRWLRHQAAKRTTRVTPWTSKIVRWPYDGLVGYGYYPLKVLAWLLILWLTVFALSSFNGSAFTPTSPAAKSMTVSNSNNQSERIRVTGATQSPSGYPPFSPALYAVDIAMPAAPTGQANVWTVTENTWLPIIFAAAKGFAWLLAALLLAGLTGLLRKD
jgi:hypothetical protein